MQNLKRAVAIQDISCFGKCSLTVALPLLSVVGVETSVIPTALLSTHTGGLGKPSYMDLADAMQKISDHWKGNNLSFDAIYSGYLGSEKQVEIVSDFIDSFKTEKSVVLVDPAMADNGKLYSGVTKELAEKMAQLCCKADIIVPNFTEAAIMLGEEYVSAPYELGYAEELAKRLFEKTGAMVVLTGLDIGDGNVGALIYNGHAHSVFAPKTEGHYHGTGDIFAAVLLGAYLNGKSLEDSAKIAVEFTANSIYRTKQQGTDPRFGVNFEGEIPKLIKILDL